MARFYASIQGSRGEATRTGTTSSGISGHICGWDIGAEVHCYTDQHNNDRVVVKLTGGSNNKYHSKLIWSGTRADLDALIGERKD